MGWCGENADAVGTGQPTQFIVAARFLPSDLTGMGVSNGDKLTKIAFIPWYTAGITFSVGVFQGGTSPTNPGSLVYEQVVTQSLTAYQYNEITLTNPVTINTSQELWMAYSLTITQYSQYPAGCDAGPRVVDKGDLMYFNGAWGNLYTLTSRKSNANWNITGYVETGGTPPPPPDKKYNVYRDGIRVASNLSQNYYTDTGFSPSEKHTWSIKIADCGSGSESSASSVTKESCIVGVDELRVESGEWRVFPNPTKGELWFGFTHHSKVESGELRVENIEIFDLMGRNVGAYAISPNETGNTTINVEALPVGMYFLRVGDKTAKFVKQ
jgi:hypothetical protein